MNLFIEVSLISDQALFSLRALLYEDSPLDEDGLFD